MSQIERFNHLLEIISIHLKLCSNVQVFVFDKNTW